MTRRRIAGATVVLVAAALAFGAFGTSSEASAPAATRAVAGTAGTMSVRFTVNRFVRRGNRVVATGVAIATFKPTTGAPTVVRKAFTATVRLGVRLFAAQRLCQVLFLQLDKLSLNLLGLHVDLDKVILTITANSKGGVLGSLFCSLAHTRVRLLHAASTGQLTQLARTSGLASSGIGFAVPMPKQSGSAEAALCQVLDLVLGPLDLNLLGLMVHLNQVHLTITADPNGGALGSLFCSLSH
jgi:hypothetical protein